MKDSNVIFAGATNATEKPSVREKSKDVTLGKSKCGAPWKKGTTRSNLHVTPFKKKKLGHENEGAQRTQGDRIEIKRTCA